MTSPDLRKYRFTSGGAQFNQKC